MCCDFIRLMYTLHVYTLSRVSRIKTYLVECLQITRKVCDTTHTDEKTARNARIIQKSSGTLYFIVRVIHVRTQTRKKCRNGTSDKNILSLVSTERTRQLQESNMQEK